MYKGPVKMVTDLRGPQQIRNYNNSCIYKRLSTFKKIPTKSKE